MFDSIFFLVYNIDCKIIRNGTDYMQEITNDVIERAKKGSSADIEYIFARFKGSVASCAAKLRTEFFDFDDAVQEGNIGLFKAILGYREDRNASFPTYAKKCILNNMLSARKSAYSNKNRVLNNALPLDESILLQSFEFDLIAREQNREFIESARQKLSKFEFLVFSLHTMQYSYGEIAKIVNKSEKSVNNAIKRIHKKLRQ